MENKSWRKGFLTIASGQTISLIGSSAVQFALIWWLASETASPLILSLAGLLAFLPHILLGPFAGVWIDRLNRKTVIICADLFIGLVAAVFAVLFFFFDPPYWSACIVLGIRAIGGVFHTPAIQAVVPTIVPKDQLIRANGWSQFMLSGALMLGPVIGAAMYAAFPLQIILLTDLVGAVVASISVAVVKIPHHIRAEQVRTGFFSEIKEGISLFLSDRKLGIVTLASAACMVFFMPLGTFYPLMSSDFFKVSAIHASIAEIAYAVGMMLAAFALTRRGTIKNKLAVVHIGLLASAVISFFCGILPQSMTGFWIFMTLCLILGASGNVYNIPYVAYMQESIPNEAQGRAFSLLGSLMSITMPIGLLIAGPVAERYGVPLWFFISGIAIFIIASFSAMVTLTKRSEF